MTNQDEHLKRSVRIVVDQAALSDLVARHPCVPVHRVTNAVMHLARAHSVTFGGLMRVKVLIATDDGKSPHELLVVPYGPTVFIPPPYQHLKWSFLAAAKTSDTLLSTSPSELEAIINRDGYAIIQQTNRRGSMGQIRGMSSGEA